MSTINAMSLRDINILYIYIPIFSMRKIKCSLVIKYVTCICTYAHGILQKSNCCIHTYIKRQERKRKTKHAKIGYFCISISIFYCKQNKWNWFFSSTYIYLKSLERKQKRYKFNVNLSFYQQNFETLLKKSIIYIYICYPPLRRSK